MHMGAGKTWYGVPRDVAVAFVRYPGQCRSRQCTCLAVGREWGSKRHMLLHYFWQIKYLMYFRFDRLNINLHQASWRLQDERKFQLPKDLMLVK
ncbi:hypothetical protein Tco_1342049, partial [Tanacetum coccineum]